MGIRQGAVTLLPLPSLGVVIFAFAFTESSAAHSSPRPFLLQGCLRLRLRDVVVAFFPALAFASTITLAFALTVILTLKGKFLPRSIMFAFAFAKSFAKSPSFREDD